MLAISRTSHPQPLTSLLHSHHTHTTITPTQASQPSPQRPHNRHCHRATAFPVKLPCQSRVARCASRALRWRAPVTIALGRPRFIGLSISTPRAEMAWVDGGPPCAPVWGGLPCPPASRVFAHCGRHRRVKNLFPSSVCRRRRRFSLALASSVSPWRSGERPALRSVPVRPSAWAAVVGRAGRGTGGLPQAGSPIKDSHHFSSL